MIIKSNVKITGEVAVNGGISATGTIKSDSDVLANTISLKQHVHTGNLGNPTSAPIGVKMAENWIDKLKDQIVPRQNKQSNIGSLGSIVFEASTDKNPLI